VIKPEGNKRVDSGAILRKIQTKVGDIYDPKQLREDLKSIFAMGYFNDVQIVVNNSARGKIVTFRVVEKPIISQIIIEGQKEFKEEEILAVIDVKKYHILNPNQVNQSSQAIKAMYDAKGFYNSTVTSDISYPTEAGAVVTFTIDEGKKIYIEEIQFEGNEHFDKDDLIAEIETGEKTWWLTWLTEEGLLDMDKILLDVDRIAAFYHNHGFLDAKVAEPVVTQEEDKIFLKFIIEEGARYRVGTVDFEGDLLLSRKELAKLVSVRKEPYLSRQILREDIRAIQDAYSARGYAFASIRPRTEKSREGNRIDINFQIAKNDLVYIDRITIKGNTRTRDNVIRRELRIVEGGKFDSAALRQSNKALQRLGFFEEVSITPEPTSDPTRMNIVVSVKEKPTGRFSIGVGYSTTDNLILSGEISENNFPGRGDTLSFSADISGSSQKFNLAYTNPRLNDSMLSWGVDIFSTEREYDDYDRENKGFGFRIGYPIYEKWYLYGNYSLTNTELSKISANASWIIKNSADIELSSAVEISLVRDTR
ncbi:MAG TPA: outer membrane protein assembly factor BamA, partial [Desulfobacterales bacterium]|nr:outer membrane protein assembly factor BamA [Desulfobacterales bacterium]